MDSKDWIAILIASVAVAFGGAFMLGQNHPSPQSPTPAVCEAFYTASLDSDTLTHDRMMIEGTKVGCFHTD